MHPTMWTVLRALRAGTPLSRNKHFTLFKDPHARRALRLHRYLNSVAHDLDACGDQVTVQLAHDASARFALRIDFPRLHGHRTAYLSALEFKLLKTQAPDAFDQLTQMLKANQ